MKWFHITHTAGVGTFLHIDLLFIVQNTIQFSTGTSSSTERMRIDSSGNVLVGKTDTTFSDTGILVAGSGSYNGTRTGKPMSLNRIGSDGEILEFYKDSTSVGSIRAISNTLSIDGASNRSGIRFANAIIQPKQNGSIADNTVDLGTSAEKFKDLYLGGTITLGDGHQLGDETTYDNLVIKSSTDEHIVYSSGGTGVHIFKTGSTSLDNGDERMRMTNDGKLGINTSSPNRTLTVDGTANIVDDNGGLYIGTAASGGFGGNHAIARAAVNGYHTSGSTVGDFCIGAAWQTDMLFGTSTASSGGLTTRMIIKDSGNVGIGTTGPTQKLDVNGTVKATAFQGDGSALTGISSGAGSVEAWVNFDGTGTPSIRDSGNVSSISDNGTGYYTVNFTSSLANASYAVTGMAKKNDSNTDGYISMGGTSVPNPGTGACRVYTFGGSSEHDCKYVCVAFIIG